MEPSTILTNLVKFQGDNILLRKKYEEAYFIPPQLEDNTMIEKTILSILYARKNANTTLILQKVFEELLGIPIKILPIGKNTSIRFFHFRNFIESQPIYLENRAKFLKEVELMSQYNHQLNMEKIYDSILHTELYNY